MSILSYNETLDTLERSLLNAVIKIFGDPPTFEDRKLREILREVAVPFTALRQLYLHTPVRTQHEQIVGNDYLDSASYAPHVGGNIVDDSWRDHIPGLSSPLDLDMISGSLPSDGSPAYNTCPSMSESPQALLGHVSTIRGYWKTDKGENTPVVVSSISLPGNAPTYLSNEPSRSNAMFLADRTSSMAETSSISDMSMITDGSSRTATPDLAYLSLTRFTPASTPPSAHRVSLVRTFSSEEASTTSSENQHDDDNDADDREDCPIHEAEDHAERMQRESSVVSCKTTNARSKEYSAACCHATDVDADTDDRSPWHDYGMRRSPSAMAISDAHTPTKSAKSRTSGTSRKRKGSPAKNPNKRKAPRVSERKPGFALHPQSNPEYMKPLETFLDELGSQNMLDQSIALLIQRSFYAIGHPQWFGLLRDACSVLRRRHDQIFPTSDGSLSQSLRLVDGVEHNGLLGRILRRYGLVGLVTHRNGARVQRASTSVLTHMLREACPELEAQATSSVKFQEGLKKLRQALKDGRNWYVLAEKFGPGILALVPTESAFGISNTGIEKMPDNSFNILLDTLDRGRGQFLRSLSQALAKIPELLLRRDFSFRYRFEGDENIEKYDVSSQSLLDSCAEQ